MKHRSCFVTRHWSLVTDFFMDRLIYTAMTGAKHLLDQQAVVAHNLANANTTGFRAELSAFRAVPVVGDGLNTRAFVVGSTVTPLVTSNAIMIDTSVLTILTYTVCFSAFGRFGRIRRLRPSVPPTRSIAAADRKTTLR